MIWGETTEQKLWVYKLHAWFAWHPVKLNNGRWVWLQWIWRQKNTTRGGDSWDTAIYICSFTKMDELAERKTNGKNGA